MNRTLQCYLVGVAALILLPGCASHKRAMAPRPTAAQTVIQVIPPQGRPEPKVAPINDRPIPIYQNPIIEEVDASPYVSAEGNLVFPGKMLVIREPGHWNLDAAKRQNQYYIPADNMPAQLVPPSKSYYDYIQTKRNGVSPAKQMDVTQVHVTGFTQKEDEAAARATLNPGETLAFDQYLGWISVPNPLLQPEGTLSTTNAAPTAPVKVPSSSVPDQTLKLAPPEPAPSVNPPYTNAPPVALTPPPKPSPDTGHAPAPNAREEEVKKMIEEALRQQPGTSAPLPTPSTPVK